MTTNYHTPHSTTERLPATGATLNAPLGELDEALTKAQGGISTLQGQMTAASGEIDTLQTEMATAQSNISTLQGQIATATASIAFCGRLTLVSGNPEPGLVVSDTNTIYFTPYNGNLSTLYRIKYLKTVKFSELALSLDYGPGIERGRVYDVYLVDDNGTLRIGFGPAWAFPSDRGTGALSAEITLKDGIWVNANAMNLTCGLTHVAVTVDPFMATYLGSFVATDGGQGSPTGNGKTCDDATRGYLFNAYNQTDRQVRISSLNEHAYEIRFERNWNNTRETELSVLVGLQGQIADLFAIAENDGPITIAMVLETEATGEDMAGRVELGSWLNNAGIKKSGAGKAHCRLGLNTAIAREFGDRGGYAFFVRALLTVKR